MRPRREPGGHAGNEAAAAFLRRFRPQIRGAVSGWTGIHQYTIDQVIRDMIDRCRELRLRVDTRFGAAVCRVLPPRDGDRAECSPCA